MRKLIFATVSASLLFVQPGYASSLSSAQIRRLTSGPDVYPDPNNPGYYNLKFRPNDRRAPYTIEYISQTGYIGIALNKAPLGASRASAEAYLMRILGLTRPQMCRLDYNLGVPNFVSARYSGMNLGFSFCPGAIRLSG